MKRYSAISWTLILLANSIPINCAFAKEERHEEPHAAPAHHEAPHPAAHAAPRNEAPRQQAEQKAQQQNQQRAQQQNQQRAQQQNEQRAEQQNEKREQQQQRAQQQQEKREQQQERQQEKQSENRPAMQQQQPSFGREQRPGTAGFGNPEQRPGTPAFENPGARQRNPAFGNTGARAPAFSNPGGRPGQFMQRPMTPPPLRIHAVPLTQAAPAPFLHGNISQAQRAQAQVGYQNMQNHLSAVPMTQAPPNYASVQSSQYNQYTNNYPANIGGQPITINTGNTYVNPVTNFPGWWGGNPPGPGWGWGTGFVVGAAIRAELNWLRWGWPRYYGAPPTGFMYPPNYIPTPWVYNPAANQWRQPGLMSYVGPPPPDYTMPITVQVVEPMQVTAQDPVTGEMMPETVNQLVMYNAYYHPEVGRWGYVNRAGYFIWLNTTPTVVMPVQGMPCGMPMPDQL